MKHHRVAMSGGVGYDDTLHSMPPFMWIERHETLGDLGVIAFGAYNAMGLIGSEKGGVAVVLEKPHKAVIATKDIPWDPARRSREFDKVIQMMREYGASVKRSIPESQKPAFAEWLQSEGYGVRGL
jgi:hypothetical protein